MTDQMDEQLERGLASLTEWRGPSPKLWRRALAASGEMARGRSVWHTRITWRSPLVLYGVAAVLVVAVAAAVFDDIGLSPQNFGFLFVDGTVAPSDLPSPSGLEVQFNLREIGSSDARNIPLGGLQGAGESTGSGFFGHMEGIAADGRGGRFGEGFGARGGGIFAWGQVPATGVPQGAFSIVQNALPYDRQVVRKAAIELKTKDVRAAFARVKHVLSAANGEYVQDSSLTGSGETAQANLTLRVAADRLGEVLGRLSELGTVISERTEGEDVTAQAVDLEARLRNETRVEAELLELLQKRKDSPLKEILQLRQSLAVVRNAIEQIAARREHLSRLVSLATVLVIIRAEDAPPAPPPEQPGIGAFFGRSMTNAWDKGLGLLIGTFATLLHVLVGGLIWWVLLVGAVLLIRRAIQRSSARVAAGEK